MRMKERASAMRESHQRAKARSRRLLRIRARRGCRMQRWVYARVERGRDSEAAIPRS